MNLLTLKKPKTLLPILFAGKESDPQKLNYYKDYVCHMDYHVFQYENL